MDMNKIKIAFAKAAEVLVAKESYLCDLDGETGDGDHGITAAKIGKAIIRAAEGFKDDDLSEFFFCIFDEIMTINGGSIGPLWGLMADGAANALKNDSPESAVKRAFNGALAGIREVSPAAAGDKSLADPLIAAIEAVNCSDNNAGLLLEKAADAAMAAAENTRNMPAKFGRAKNLPDKGIGHLDPGAVSFALFVNELSRSYKEAIDEK